MAFSVKTPLLVCGVLLLGACCAVGAPLELATELFAEGDWAAARREAARAALASPTNEPARLLRDVCALRLAGRGEAAAGVVTNLAELALTAASKQVRGMAALEAARWYVGLGQPKQAWPWLRRAFQAEADDGVTLAAGGQLLWLARHHPSWLKDDDALSLQLAVLRPVLWNVPLMEGPSHAAWTGRPGTWLVSFYRGQIRPVLGSRCLLRPSCSEYFLRASRRFGWLGVPMIGDRLVREPSAVQDARDPIESDGRMTYADPIEWHTFWWKKGKP